MLFYTLLLHVHLRLEQAVGTEGAQLFWASVAQPLAEARKAKAKTDPKATPAAAPADQAEANAPQRFVGQVEEFVSPQIIRLQDVVEGGSRTLNNAHRPLLGPLLVHWPAQASYSIPPSTT